MKHASEAPLSSVFAAHRWRLVGSVVLFSVTMVAGTALLGLSGGFLTASALAGLAGLGGSFNFFSPSAGIRALTMVRIVSRYFEKLVGHDATLRIARDLRVWFFARALPLAPGKLGNTRTGELLARLMGDIAEVDGLFVRAIGPLLAMGVVTVAALLAAWLVYWPAALLLLLLALVIGLWVPLLAVRGGNRGEGERAQRRASLRTLAFEGLEGAADLLAQQAQGRWIVQVDEAARKVAGSDRRRRRHLLTAQLLHGLCASAGLVAIIAIALDGHAAHGLAPALAAALVFMTVALLELWAGAGLAWQSLVAGKIAAARLQAIVEQAPAVSDPSRPQPLRDAGPMTGLSLHGVRFAWPGQARPVLDGLDLSLAPGQRIAIGGDSGSGKSTLSLLILRQADPQAGQLLWNGQDLRELALAQWHQQLAWMPQGAPVFAGTLAENLRLGDAGADDARLWEVLERVRLADWARATGGLQQWLGENGATVSGGQARRLALARALLRPGPLVLLDEPTEGLDVDTANALLADLPAALGGRSLLMITHDALPPGVVDVQYRLQGGRLQRP
ncbi:thiol reductant ABC exporter subunit CydC [Stenotrophomonas sp. W1S232]|uniref:Thiol reductant ABC exporter subunit CydC n=1 Tax=Stenotrophomonas koreensis TaxID=266128 RepID=A0A7W3UZ88_9GAMM|nr:thiol reductant ABC exporter subunit CydC [Stenotrophomonas koreensis]MBB1116604.1 thiol reductant ABC exporter subunit CydC [Stenotrophomonas koreensis]